MTLYTIDCPKCKVLEAKLNKANIEYETVKDLEQVEHICDVTGIETLPILKVNNKYLSFKKAVDYINENT